MHYHENGKPNRRPGSAARFSTDLTQGLGRAQRRPAGQPAGTRDLPGLMARAHRPMVPAPAMRMPVPVPRSALDNGVTTMNGHRGEPGRSAMSNGDPLADFRRISAGLAIAPKVSVVLPVMNEAENLPGVFGSLPAWVDEVVLVDGRS